MKKGILGALLLVSSLAFASTGIEHRGLNYVARVDSSGLHMQSGGVRVRMHGRGVVEEYRFEERRVEQLFHIAKRPAKGALKIHVDVETNLEGKLQPAKDGVQWKEFGGERTMSYYGAVAIDAAGRRIDLKPAPQQGGILLEVPEEFMAAAKYPVLVDPWIELGGSATGYGVSGGVDFDSFDPTIVLDSKTRPTVAWTESADFDAANLRRRGFIHLARWTGVSWIELGGSMNFGISAAAASHPSLVLDKFDNPFIAFANVNTNVGDIDGQTEIFVKYYDPNVQTWKSYPGLAAGDTSSKGGGISNTPGHSTNPSLALDPQGNPVIAWEEEVDPVAKKRAVYVRAWNGTAWKELDNSATGNGICPEANTFGNGVNPSLAIDSFGNLFVAWQNNNPSNIPGHGFEIFLRRYDVATAKWVSLAGVDPLDTSASGGGISNTGPINSPAGGSFGPKIKVDGNGRIAATWWTVLKNQTRQIYLRLFLGGAWKMLPGVAPNDLSATGGGVSNGTWGVVPSLTFGPHGILSPIVTWHEFDPVFNTSDIRLRMFNVFGGGWAEIDKSATGGGISHTGAAISPVVAVNKSGLFPAVAWMDRTPHIQAANNGNGDANKVEVYLRQFTRTGVMPGALAQFDAPDHPVPAGGRINGGAITFGGVVTATEGAGSARLEVEMQRVGARFTGEPNVFSEFAPTGMQALVTAHVGAVTQESWRWQARTVDEFGATSDWVAFGSGDPTVADFVAPALFVPPGNMTVEATGRSGAVVTYEVPSFVSCAPASGSTFPLGTTPVNCGPFSFTVTVTDTTPPTLNLPSSISVDAASPVGAVVRYEVSALDLVDGSVPVVCSPVSGSTFSVGTGRVNCSASDRSRNPVTGGFTVTVRSPVEMLTTLIVAADGNNLLTSALRQLGTPAACNQLNAFQHQRQPANLITLAQQVSTALGCR